MAKKLGLLKTKKIFCFSYIEKVSEKQKTS